MAELWLWEEFHLLPPAAPGQPPRPVPGGWRRLDAPRVGFRPFDPNRPEAVRRRNANEALRTADRAAQVAAVVNEFPPQGGFSAFDEEAIRSAWLVLMGERTPPTSHAVVKAKVRPAYELVLWPLKRVKEVERIEVWRTAHHRWVDRLGNAFTQRGHHPLARPVGKAELGAIAHGKLTTAGKLVTIVLPAGAQLRADVRSQELYLEQGVQIESASLEFSDLCSLLESTIQ